MSINNLRQWSVNPAKELPELDYLDVTGNNHWLPDQRVLQLSMLARVEGVRMSQYCDACALCKTMPSGSTGVNSSCPSNHDKLSSPSAWEWRGEIQYGKALDFIDSGFWPTCLVNDVCKTEQYRLPYTAGVGDGPKKGSFALYATGSMALLVNIAVVVLIVMNRDLRADLAVFLALNIAVCDVLVGMTTLLHARFEWGILYTEYLLDQLQGNDYDFHSRVIKINNIRGVILTCAVTSQVLCSALAMLDKFLKIVFAMKPDIRLGRRAALLALMFSWLLSTTFAILPAFRIGDMAYTDNITGSSPLPTDKRAGDKLEYHVGFATGSQVALLSFQLAGFVLYLPIFIVAKRSGANVGIQRTAAIARKIALVIFTNLVLFTVPIVCVVFEMVIWSDAYEAIEEDWTRCTLDELHWYLFTTNILPGLCLSINAALDPFLYVLRHPKVKQQLDRLRSQCRSAMGECFAYLMQKIECNSTTVDPTNHGVEMQEEKL